MRNKLFVCTAMAAMVFALGIGIAQADDAWSGEIIEKACYEKDHNNLGEGHAECAKSCFSSGAEMGLLVNNAEIIMLRADPDKPKPFEDLKERAGKMAKVEGTMMEEGDMKVVTVMSMEAVN